MSAAPFYPRFEIFFVTDPTIFPKSPKVLGDEYQSRQIWGSSSFDFWDLSWLEGKCLDFVWILFSCRVRAVLVDATGETLMSDV